MQEDDPESEIANLEAAIAMLRREERRLLSILLDDFQTNSHDRARQDLQKVETEMLAAIGAIHKLRSKP